jgi:CBS domain-containing protein
VKEKFVAYCAGDVMQTGVVTVSPDAPLSAVRQLFVDEGIHGAPVVDERMRVLGVISTTDLLRAASEAAESARPERTYDSDAESEEFFTLAAADEIFTERLGEARTSDYMTNGAVSVPLSASIPDLARAFRQHKVHRVLVVERGVLQGIVSTFDLIALLEQIDPTTLEKALPIAR